jgi:hypothetical protein
MVLTESFIRACDDHVLSPSSCGSPFLVVYLCHDPVVA